MQIKHWPTTIHSELTAMFAAGLIPIMHGISIQEHLKLSILLFRIHYTCSNSTLHRIWKHSAVPRKKRLEAISCLKKIDTAHSLMRCELKYAWIVQIITVEQKRNWNCNYIFLCVPTKSFYWFKFHRFRIIPSAFWYQSDI